MKNLTLYAIAALLSVLSSCTLKEVINPDGTIKNANTTGGTSPTNSTSYQPITAGSTWKYAVDDYFNGPDEITVTITGKLTTIGGLPYNEYTVIGKNNVKFTNYFYSANHGYVSREEIPNFSSFVDNIPYLADDAAVNETWKTTWYYLGTSFGTFTGTMKEVNSTRIVNGVTYNNVFHTRVAAQLDISTSPDETIDYYIAKGVGIIEESVVQKQVVIYTRTLESYKIN